MAFTYSDIALVVGLLGTSLIFAIIGLWIDRTKQGDTKTNPVPIIFKMLFLFLSVTSIYTLENILSKLASLAEETAIKNTIDMNIIVPTQVIMFAIFVYLVVVFILYVVKVVEDAVNEGKRVAQRSETRAESSER